MDEHETAEMLKQTVRDHDLDWIVYQLVQGAVERRDEADEDDNPAEKKYWQRAVSALLNF